jgi:septal ring factor EnvC (AmiA/AmiB activator)
MKVGIFLLFCALMILCEAQKKISVEASTSTDFSKLKEVISNLEKENSKLNEKIFNLEKKISLLERESSNLREILLNFLSTSIASGDRKMESFFKDSKKWWEENPWGRQLLNDLKKKIKEKEKKR